MLKYLLAGLLLVLVMLAYAVWVTSVYLRYVRERRLHYLEHGHRRARRDRN